MRKILFQFHGHDHGQLFNEAARDATLDPFIYLRNRLREIGYQLETADDHSLKGCTGIWFWDLYDAAAAPRSLFRQIGRSIKQVLTGQIQLLKQRNLYLECIRAGLQDKMVLFVGEPPVVFPYNWDLKLHEAFPIIFTWNDDYIDGKKYHKFCWPITSKFPDIPAIPFLQKKLLINISANKFSTHPHELYSARRNTIRFFEQHYPDQFDLYGVGWDQPGNGDPNYRSYRGVIRHKWDVYPGYRFGVCYENMSGEPGWITEKIFDCMRADCVPIYWGASNIVEFVDENTFIDRQKFGSEAELAEYLLSMNEADYNQYRQAIQDYLQSERFAAFLPPAFADNVINVLSL